LKPPPIRRREEVSMRKQLLSRVVLASAIVVGMHAPVASAQRADDSFRIPPPVERYLSPARIADSPFPIPPPVAHGATPTARG
jgi:hypothetical protein